MLISEKQQEANRQNAQHSCGPITPEGKVAVRLNALTYGLRARSILIPGEDPEEYKQLWADLMADWQPQNRTERMHLEQMATSQWLLARVALGESDIYQKETSAENSLHCWAALPPSACAWSVLKCCGSSPRTARPVVALPYGKPRGRPQPHQNCPAPLHCFSVWGALAGTAGAMPTLASTRS